jgi:hypothetical protein
MPQSSDENLITALPIVLASLIEDYCAIVYAISLGVSSTGNDYGISLVQRRLQDACIRAIARSARVTGRPKGILQHKVSV